KAHEFEWVVSVFCFRNEGVDVVNTANLIEHVENGFVSATVCWAPKGTYTRSESSVRVSTRRTGYAHRRGGSVLFEVCVQDENAIHGLCNHRRDSAFFAVATK